MPLSQKQMEYLALAWQCFDAEPKIEYEKFHKLAGLASANSARELMRVTKNKLKEEYGALGAANGTPSKSAGTPTKAPASAKKATTPGSRKRVAAKKSRTEGDGEDEVDDEEELKGSPTKKMKVKKERNGVEQGEGDVKTEE